MGPQGGSHPAFPGSQQKQVCPGPLSGREGLRQPACVLGMCRLGIQ